MELFVEAGLSPMQAIQTATHNNAKFLRQEHIGTLAVGKRADLLIVNGNPLQDIRQTQAIHMVMKGGQIGRAWLSPRLSEPNPQPASPVGLYRSSAPSHYIHLTDDCQRWSTRRYYHD